MPLSTMLFSFTGRLNRARFWLASTGLIVVSLVLSPIAILSWVLIATSPLSLGALIAVEGLSVMPIASAGLLFVSFVYLLVSFAALLVLFAGLAVAIKRLHDRDKSAWWLLLFALVPLILQTIAYYTDRTGTGAVEVRLILGLACLSIGIWFLAELGFLRGTVEPLRPRPAADWPDRKRRRGPRREICDDRAADLVGRGVGRRIGASHRARATWPMVRGPFGRISPDAGRTE